VRVAWTGEQREKRGVPQGFCRGGGVRDREEFEGGGDHGHDRSLVAFTCHRWSGRKMKGGRGGNRAGDH
jgi:hypothetical protein